MEVFTLKLKVISVGSSMGVVLPEEALARLKPVKGNSIFLTESSNGIRLTSYDPEFEEQMTRARKFMRQRRDALRELAK